MKQENIEAVFKLTGLQEAFLLHHLQAKGNDQGVIQMHTTIQGYLPEDILEKAWRYIIQLHPALRTSLHWKNIKHPVQAVHKQVDFQSSFYNWSDKSESQVTESWIQLLKEDAEKGMDLENAPAFRVTRVRLNPKLCRLVWTCHHILLDGWSSSIVLEQVFELCKLRLLSRPWNPKRVSSFKEFVTWEQSISTIRQSRKWRELLDGHYTQSVRFFATPVIGIQGRQKLIEHTISSVSPDELRLAGSTYKVTPTTILIAAWTALLIQIKGEEHCVTGLTVSGRSNPLPDNSGMVGMFANSIPFPATMASGDTSRICIERIFATQESLQALETTPALRIHQWCNLPARQELFDSLLVVDNYPTHEESPDSPFQVSPVEGKLTSRVPITLVFSIGEKITLKVQYDSRIFDHEWIQGLTNVLEDCLSVLTLNPDGLPAGIPCNLPAIKLQTLASDLPIIPSKPAEDVRTFEEGLIREIWVEVLGTEEIGPADNFFELGGNSLMAAHLIEKLQTVFQKPFPINLLFEAPTVQKLAEILISGNADDWPILILLQKGGDKPPLFLFHEMGVSIFHYQHLIHHLPPDIPVYGVQAPYEPFEDIRSMTEFYLNEIRKIYPDGSYYLGGYCFGAMLAFDMAQLLKEQGTPPLQVFAIELTFLNIVRFRPKYIWNLLISETPKQHMVRVKNKLVKIASRIIRSMKPGTGGFKDEAKDFFDTNELPETTRIKTEIHYRAARDYKPKRYEGDVVAIICESEYSARDPYVGWDKLVGGNLDFSLSKSDHHSILNEPYVKAVGERMCAHMNQKKLVDQLTKN